MVDNELLTLIRELGFPIFVCIWFMFRTEKIIEANTTALVELTQVVSSLYDEMEAG